MIKKISKFFVLALLLFFIFSLNSVYAKTVTLNDLNSEVKKLTNEETKQNFEWSDYLYLIGKYIFTAEHELTTEDIMLAARSITPSTENAGETASDPIYKDMVIYQLDRTDNDGWEMKTKLTGETELPTNIDIDYIDYEYLKEDTKFTVSLDEVAKSTTENGLLTKLKGLGYNGNYAGENGDKLTLSADGKLSGLIEITNDMPDTTFSGAKKTGYYFAYVLDVDGTVTEKTTVTLKSNGEEKSIPYTAFDDQANGKMAVLVSLDKNATNKTITVVVDLDGEGNKYVAKSYTIDWSGVTFQEASKATISTENLPQSDVDTISSDWGYAKTAQDTYKLDTNGSDPFTLKLTGTVVKQDIKDNIFPCCHRAA